MSACASSEACTWIPATRPRLGRPKPRRAPVRDDRPAARGTRRSHPDDRVRLDRLNASTPGDTIALGLDTFGDVTLAADGTPFTQAQVLRNVVDEAVLADQVGVAFFGVGEHHRRDFAVSAPEVVLAAIAARTSRIHLGSAVTVLSTDDSVRV